MFPQMELQSAGPSTPTVITDGEGNIIDSNDGGEPIQFVFEDIHWTSEISHQEAARRLDVTFYPFKKVNSRCLLSTRLTLTQEITSFLGSSPGVLPAFLRGLWTSWSWEQTGAFHSALGSARWPVLLRWNNLQDMKRDCSDSANAYDPL